MNQGGAHKWLYLTIEYICYVLFLLALVYRALGPAQEKNPSASEYLQILPIPLLFLGAGVLFRYLASDKTQDGKTPFIAAIVGLFQLLDLQGAHLWFFGTAVALGALAAFTDSQKASDLFKFVSGIFTGLLVEKKRHQTKPELTGDGGKTS